MWLNFKYLHIVNNGVYKTARRFTNWHFPFAQKNKSVQFSDLDKGFKDMCHVTYAFELNKFLGNNVGKISG
jgi:hypothetical protein